MRKGPLRPSPRFFVKQYKTTFVLGFNGTSFSSFNISLIHSFTHSE